MFRTVALLSALIALSAGPVVAQSPTFVGRWHWNRSASTLAPGEPAPKDVVLDITDASVGHLRWSLSETDPTGQTHAESFDGPADGRPGTLTGAEDQTSASFTLDLGNLRAVFYGPEGASDSWSCSVSADGRRMTCAGTEADGQGHTRGYTDVYDRG